MATFNLSSFNPGPFILLGIPGLQQFHIWIGIPFFISYPVALVGNGVLLYLVSMERSLHEPMFFFLFMLAATDLILSNTCLPKTFSIFWLGSQEITFSGCLTQMFFHHYSFVMESAIQLAMAFDRYVAICFPLKYNIILTQQIISKIVMGIIIRSFCIIFPCVFLLKRLPFCQTHLIPIMTHMGIAKLACTSIKPNTIYGLTVALSITGMDVILIATSYVLILRAVLRLPSKDAQFRAFSTCGAHICVILVF
uniref:G-protein coupled receptors family 1 profile domain-containing protein n=1 Tax=Otolemur garnettii TaxID=30611 RepID=H0XJ32_OTOGA